MEGQDNMEDPSESGRSIGILRNKSTKLLSAMLNPPKVIPTCEGLPRNWKGLAELCLIESYLISNIEFNSDPTKETLRIWQDKGDEASIRRLIENLQKLDRYDVIDDIIMSLAEDIEFHKLHPNGYRNQRPLCPDRDKDVLTVDDVANIDKNVQLINYDAFVLFAEDDIDFATEVIETMEKQYNLKFCVKDRDLVGGTFEHNAIIKLISERCEKLIIILSPSFFNSPVNKFFLHFTQAISLEQRKIIPCLYKECPKMPPEVRCYFMLDYTKPRVLCNIWDRLYEAIKTQKPPPNASNRIALPLVRRDQPPRQLISKRNSQRESDSRLKPTGHSIKFNSMVDLTKQDVDQMIQDANLAPSTSANSLGIATADDYVEPDKKFKEKKNWFKKLLQKYEKNYDNKCNNKNIKINGECDVNKDKKKFWSRHKKRKVEIAT